MAFPFTYPLKPAILSLLVVAPSILWLSTLASRAGEPGHPDVPARSTLQFEHAFAPTEGWVQPMEQPQREEVCLDGRWQFQPVPLPPGFVRDRGEAPELPSPTQGGWDSTPIKIPSPWNVNTWGGSREVGAGTDRPYEPGALYYPSYPASWDGVEMGWVRRRFRVPDHWTNRRVVLRFESVAGDCQVIMNGQPAGTHFDKYLPFELDVTRLVRRDADNELLVGVRATALFNKQSVRYPKMRAPYPCGSETEHLAGIWQDVFLLGLPPLRVEDTFVKPLLDQDTLELEVTLRNDGDREQSVTLGGDVRPWVNLAGADTLSAPEPRWKLDPMVLTLENRQVTIKPGETTLVTLHEHVGGRLRPWTPDTPNLYTAVLSVSRDGDTIDRRCVRFGWRQFKIAGRDLMLNGTKIQLFADILHPFGPFIMSRRYTWAWYRLIKDFGGNAVRLHAQIHPRHFLDLADEMGIIVLDETALFGSSIALNFEEPAAWQRFAEHYDGLVLRDRNHPSVFGWSFGNELFAIFNLNQVSKEDTDRWYTQLAALGERARKLDPTREWISCDGDEDLRGALPVWSRHFGHGTPLDQLPDLNKPLMVGESGGTYYATPAQLAIFNGDRAYESYAGRSEALAIDVYDNIVRMARPRLAYYSASETAWFGVEHLPFGYHDFTRLPDDHDGILFGYQDGKPGMQIERLPPYVCTLNPGWDPTLPLYKPLPMFEAEKAALAKGGPQTCPWDHRPEIKPGPDSAVPVITDHVDFIGDRESELFRRLAALGVPFEGADGNADLVIVDGDGMAPAALERSAAGMIAVLARGGNALVLAGQDPASVDVLNHLLPAPVQITTRPATALVPLGDHPWTAGFDLPDLYFAESPSDRFILKYGLTGPFVEQGRVLMEASNTDWSLFNNQPERSKCGAEVLYESLVKPGRAALVEQDRLKGRLALCTIDWRVHSRNADALWRKLLSNMGVKLHEPHETAPPAFDDKNALVNALSIGRFGSNDLESAFTKDFLGGSITHPHKGVAIGSRAWTAVNCPSHDRFMLDQLQQGGPEDGFAVYFAYSIKSLRALDDILTAGPDAPKFATLCYVSEKCRFYLNGQELTPTRTEPADYRTLYTFDGIPLKKGWNQVLIKVVSDHLTGDKGGTLAVRAFSNSTDFQWESAVEPDSDAR